ncbi:MAG: hypothetical protein ISR90_00110 [Candidatus Marinimicrobia bacterium]|nr:hypothetical protein [Candidatus Neomarinimicrobiota bacterium]MBL7022444.1 hypothetical protein [Candidatus Neomarinimicrobiota bacterium]MBL7108701.1 hypothetical protein [Candidatus Neomarinimicrobiota bacterium]
MNKDCCNPSDKSCNPKVIPGMLCYCFKFTEDHIKKDIERTGATDIPDKIRLEIQNDNCRCSELNPSGKCCLGNVLKFVNSLES